ncbi:MAG: methionine--tRNA ligase [Gemmatimonas sp.]|nr:methionine--tRNA ligase [Gemmatimonas sp.]
MAGFLPSRDALLRQGDGFSSPFDIVNLCQHQSRLSQKPFYITTAIDYANGLPHIGHALEKIGADTIARYQRQLGRDVHFLMGMDEYGKKVAQSAEVAGVSPQEWTDRIAGEFESAWQALNVSNTDFIRTTELRHTAAVEEMVRRMEVKGDLYLDTYAGFYCVGCESYKAESDLIDGRCPEHPTLEVEWMEEEDWFFRLSRYREPLLRLLDGGNDFLRPESRRNEVRRMIEGIKDISVSRSGLDWGIPWPGHPDHVIYVWIDALTNYLTATGFPAPDFDEVWPADLHVIGKDIIRFHCVYWPAMLMSADLPVPRCVWAHGWMTLDGRKISKSSGAWVGIQEAAERYGVDALRYFVLREIPWDSDGNFTWQRFDERYTSELANDLGNLANRTVSMLQRYADGIVPAGEETDLDVAGLDALARYRDRMDQFLLHEGAAAAFQLVSAANAFVENRAPWKLAKDLELRADLNATLRSLVLALARIAVLLAPFMPDKMSALWTSIGGEGPLPFLDSLGNLEPAGWKASLGTVLFPRPDLAR